MPGSCDAASSEIRAAADRLAAAQLVAYPTETFWGLAALAHSHAALAALRRFKGRAQGRPISILVSGARDLPELGFTPSAEAAALVEAFWPGPLTLVMPCESERFAAGIARQTDGAVGVRCSPHPVANALAAECARRGLGPITATSLNRSGEAPAASRAEALVLCAALEEGPTVLAAAPFPGLASQPSTVIDLCVSPPRLLRAGALSRAAVAKTIQLAPEEEARK